jgi:hypothetical protein
MRVGDKMVGDVFDQILIGIVVISVIALIAVLTGAHERMGGGAGYRLPDHPENRYPDDKPQAYYSNRR